MGTKNKRFSRRKFIKYGIDAVLIGHLHTYRRRDRLYNFQPDTRGSLYIVTGVAGNVRYQSSV